ncbi:alpha/beta fold hydrolase [Streptomyces bobili]|uniref:alpha/beta hydrolase n=1 Tax=Streptomyces bobili TaxID=67280 RepID=UPI00341E267E
MVLVHGLWTTPLIWEHWVTHYAAQGFRVLAPAWPGVEREVEDLRTDPSSLAGVGLEAVLDRYEGIVRRLDRPPILIGHSFGGTIVQLLLDRGLGVAGVALHSAAVKGVRPLPLSTLRSTWPILRRPGLRDEASGLTFEQFRYAFANTLSMREAAVAYDRYHVPGPARVLFQGAFANFSPRAITRVDFSNDRRAPLLFIAGGEDHIVPPVVNRANARLYQRSAALTEYLEFPGRSHLTVSQEGWQEVADHAMRWVLNRALLLKT